MKRFLAWLLAGAAVLATIPASANGRFPESNHFFFSKEDPNLVILRVTFGLLVSHDRGKTFDWVCEVSVGYSGVEDPMYALVSPTKILGTTFEGIAATKDQACNWAQVGGDLANQVFIDLSANPNDPNDVVVFASSFKDQNDAGQIEFSSKIWETKNGGDSFTLLGQPLDPSLLGFTIDLAKSDPNRIYSTSVRKPGSAPVGALLTSRDHGTSWEETVIPLLGSERSLYISAVDPNDANRVYIRTANTAPDKPTRLLLAEIAPDGGPPAVKTLYSSPGELLGFALSDDGSKVYIGGPKEGVKVANTTDFAFEQRATIAIGCLGLSPDGLWACSNEGAGFVAGLSKDDGKTFQTVLHFCDIRGALSCPEESTTNSKCAALWPAQRALLGCDPVNGDGGGGGGDGGQGSGLPAAPPVTGAGSSCKCGVAPAGAAGAAALASVAAFAVTLARRARRRR